jgi:hypothetical protein
MMAYHAMPLGRFVDGLRDIVIASGAKPLVVDKIDELRSVVESLEAAEAEAQKERDNFYDLAGAVREYLGARSNKARRKELLDTLIEIEGRK